MTYTGPADLSETAGAAFVVWPDSRPGVITVATVPTVEMRRTAEILELARARGAPVPRHELAVELADGR